MDMASSRLGGIPRHHEAVAEELRDDVGCIARDGSRLRGSSVPDMELLGGEGEESMGGSEND